MKILFYDGSIDTFLWDHDKLLMSITNGIHKIINAAYGPSENAFTLDSMLENTPDSFVLTNSLVALSHVYGWNKEENHTDIYLWREKYKDFIRCDKLTLKEIKEGHNIEKMYMNGAFEEEIPELPNYLKEI